MLASQPRQGQKLLHPGVGGGSGCCWGYPVALMMVTKRRRGRSCQSSSGWGMQEATSNRRMAPLRHEKCKAKRRRCPWGGQTPFVSEQGWLFPLRPREAELAGGNVVGKCAESFLPLHERCRSKGPHAGRLRRQKLCPNNSGGQRCEVWVSAGSLSSGTSVLLGGRLLPCPHAVFPLHVCVLTSSSVGPRFPLVTSLQALSRQKSHCEVLGVRIPHMNLEDHTIQSIMGFRGAAER